MIPQQRYVVHNAVVTFVLIGIISIVTAAAVTSAGHISSSTTIHRQYNTEHNVLTTTMIKQSVEQSISQKKNQTIITFPLLPHATVMERHRRERKLSVVGINGNKSNNNNNVKVERPSYSKYHFMRVLEEAATKTISSLSMEEQEEHHRMVQEATQALQIAGLFQGYGTHYADMWCGAPKPQRQTVIVDTGSGVTAFPCNECTNNCGVPDYHIDPLYDQTISTSFHTLTCNECLRGTCNDFSDNNKGQCEFGMSYQEGSSWNAIEVQDDCYVGGFHDRPIPTSEEKDDNDIDPFHAPAFTFPMKFGCQNRITGLFITQLADGIMGMDVAQAAYWYQMYEAKKIQHKAFSLCFSRKSKVEVSGTESGAMSLGGTDERLHKTPLVYTSISNGSGFYVVTIRKMYLREGGGGLSSQSSDPNLKIIQLDLSESALNTGRVIVDSGTTDTYFSRSISSEFRKAFTQLTGLKYGRTAYQWTKEELAQQPTILIQLYGDETLNQQALDDSKYGHVVGLAGALDKDHPLDVLLAIPPEHYYEYDEEDGGYVSRFYDNEGGGGVIGANSMMGHDVYFDVENSRIGWSESDCDYTALVKQYTDGDWEPATPKPKQEIEDESRIEPTNEIGDGPADKNDEPSGKYNVPDGSTVCTGLGCQISVLVGMVAIISLVTVRVMRRVPSGPSYEIADSELELRNVSINDIEDHDEFVNQRRRTEFT